MVKNQINFIILFTLERFKTNCFFFNNNISIKLNSSLLIIEKQVKNSDKLFYLNKSFYLSTDEVFDQNLACTIKSWKNKHIITPLVVETSLSVL